MVAKVTKISGVGRARFALVAALALAALSEPARQGSAGADESAAPMTPVALPAECTTKTAVQPLIVPSWAFVLNFEVFQGGEPVACLIAFRSARIASDAVRIPCTAVAPGVSFSNGTATFTGGHIRCPLDVNAALASLTPPILQDKPSYDYPFFTIVGVGRLLASPVLTHPLSNPLVHYAPGNPGSPDLGFFVPLSNTPSTAVLTSLFNGVVNTGTVPVQLTVGSGEMQSWGVKHGGLTTYTITHAYNGTAVQSFAPRDPVRFWTAGGIFRIGVSPYGPPLQAVLDEIVIDPPDGGIPPKFAPIAMRLDDFAQRKVR